MADPSDDRVVALYELPPEEFTAARDRLASELRDAGDPGAGETRKLRRPTLGAWVVNQLARRHPDELAELVAAGERLRTAQQGVLQGGSPEALREAGNERRRLLDGLLDRAEEILAESGRPAARGRLEGVERSLMAATMSEEAAAEVARGTLSRELEPAAGFEAADVAEAPVPARPSGRDRRVERLRARSEAAEQEAREAEEDAARLDQDAQAAERAARDARRAADRAAERAATARRRARDLRRRADER